MSDSAGDLTMPRATAGSARAARKRRLRKATKGYWGARSRQTRSMIPAVFRAGQHAFIGRRRKKRDYRALWITRVTAACRMRGISYSRFMNAMRVSCVALNRKMLSELAIADPPAFDKLVAMANETIKSPTSGMTKEGRR
jgi:large subunit ribosomal protein L20